MSVIGEWQVEEFFFQQTSPNTFMAIPKINFFMNIIIKKNMKEMR